MADDGLWNVRPMNRDDFATGGLVTTPGTITIAAFGCDYIIPNRLAKILGNPFAEEEDVD